MRRLTPLFAAALATACVTINVYFPAAAAQKAADRVIDEVLGSQAAPAASPSEPAPAAEPAAPPTSRLEGGENLAAAILDFVIPAARADEPNLDVTSPETKRLTESMKARFADLGPYFDSGAVGQGSDGYASVRDPNVVPLPDRNKVRTLVANENADRAALYREIAAANRQPQWETQIRTVFAQRWAARAKVGWWVQDSDGAWKQK